MMWKTRSLQEALETLFEYKRLQKESTNKEQNKKEGGIMEVRMMTERQEEAEEEEELYNHYNCYSFNRQAHLDYTTTIIWRQAHLDFTTTILLRQAHLDYTTTIIWWQAHLDYTTKIVRLLKKYKLSVLESEMGMLVRNTQNFMVNKRNLHVLSEDISLLNNAPCTLSPWLKQAFDGMKIRRLKKERFWKHALEKYMNIMRILKSGSLRFLKQQIQDLWQLLRCKVCLDSDACMVFFPCRHMATCEYCGSFLDQCPVCRTFIEETVKVNKK